MAFGVLFLAALAAPGVRSLDVEVDLIGLYARLAPGVERPDRLVLMDLPPDQPIAELRSKIRALSGVTAVEAPLVSEVFLQQFPEDEHRRIRQVLLGKPATNRRMVGVHYGRSPHLEEELRALVPGARLVGAPILEGAHADAARREQLRLLGVLAPGLLLALWWVVGRLRLAMAVLLSVGTGALLLAGGMGWAGLSLGGPNLMLLPLVIVLGLADAVHLGHAAGRLEREGDPNPHLSALKEVALPCALTSTTTGLAFLALCLSPSPAVRQFGLLATLGMALAWGTGLLLPTAAMSSSWIRPPAEGESWELSWLRSRGLAVGLLLGFGGLAMGLQQDLVLGGELPPDSAILAEALEVDAALGGIHPVRLIVETGRPDGTGDAESVQRLQRIVTALASDPAVGAVISYIDPLRWVARRDDKDVGSLLAERMGKRMRNRRFRRLHEQVLAQIETSPVELFDEDRSAFILHLRLHDAGAAAWAHTFDRAAQVGRPLEVRPVGYPALVVGAFRQITPEVLRILSASALSGVMVLGLRTRRWRETLGGVGLLGGTTLVALGSMRLLGMPLSHTNVFVLSLALGLGLDGWIHLRAGGKGAVDSSGALIRSALVAGVGFGLLGLSALPSVRGIGGVLFITTFATLVFTLSLDAWLPAPSR